MPKAPYGEKTIQVRIRFFTDGIAARKGNIKPGHGWAAGTVFTVENASHGIKPHKAQFNSLAELPNAVEKVLVEAEIKLHPFGRGKKLYVP